MEYNRNNEPIANRADTEIIKPNSKRMEISSILEIKNKVVQRRTMRHAAQSDSWKMFDTVATFYETKSPLQPFLILR